MSKDMLQKISPALLLLLAVSSLTAQDARHTIAPLKALPQKSGGFEVVSGNPDKRGAPYVVRISNDAGYVVLPHTHPEDENIVVVQGSWTVAMGNRVDRSALKPLEVGGYALVPKKMGHFGWAKTATIIQVHGIGPFSTDFVDPVFELSESGVSVVRTAGRPGEPAQSAPPGCFVLKIGDRVRGSRGDGTVVGALCSPPSHFTQYWVQTRTGDRFWATLEEVKRV
jgi:hypothetical protein